jgi:hypothetical protein
MNNSQVWLLLTAGNLPAWNARTAGGHDSIGPDDVKFALGGLPIAPFAFGMAAFLGDLTQLAVLEEWVHTEILRIARDKKWRIPKTHRHLLEAMSALMLWETIAAKSARDVYAHEEGHENRARGEARVMCPQCLGKGRTWNGHRLSVWARYRRRLNSRYQWWLSQPSSSERRRAITYIRERRHEVTDEIKWWTDLTRDGRACQTCEGTGVFTLTERWRAKLCGVGKSQWHELWKVRYVEGLARVQRLEDWAIGHVAKRLRHRVA